MLFSAGGRVNKYCSLGRNVRKIRAKMINTQLNRAKYFENTECTELKFTECDLQCVSTNFHCEVSLEIIFDENKPKGQCSWF